MTASTALNVPARGNNINGIDQILDKPRASVYTAATTVLGSNSGVQGALPWDVLEYDTDGMFDTANNSRLTARTAGVYLVHLLFSYEGNAAGWRRSWIRKSNAAGVVVALYGAFLNTDPGGISCWLQSHWSIPLNAGDYVEGIYFQNAASPLNFNTGHDNCGFTATLIST